jgi:hypothetical protein
MGKKRSSEKPPDVPVDQNGAVVTVPETNGHAATATMDRPALPVLTAPPTDRPVTTFAARSDKTTRLEVAAWGRTVKVNGEDVLQYALTVSRSWQDKHGNWTQSGSYRVHDVPVLLFLVQQAYHWCLLQRTDIEIATDEPLLF